MIIESKADLEIKKIKQEQLVRLSDLDCVYKNKVKEANLQWNLEIKSIRVGPSHCFYGEAKATG
jgi:hypothetical protein